MTKAKPTMEDVQAYCDRRDIRQQDKGRQLSSITAALPRRLKRDYLRQLACTLDAEDRWYLSGELAHQALWDAEQLDEALGVTTDLDAQPAEGAIQ